MHTSLFYTWQGIAAQVFGLFVFIAIYRRYLSSLSTIPGPFWASVTRLWQVKHIIQGDQNLVSIALHEKHGHFFRIAPNEVSVSHPDGPKLLLQAPLRKVWALSPMPVPVKAARLLTVSTLGKLVPGVHRAGHPL